MAALIRIVPLWAWALAAVLVWGGWQKHKATSAAADLASNVAETARLRERGLAASMAETERRVSAQAKVITHAATETTRLRGDIAAARAAADGLRGDADRAAAGARSCDPAAAGDGAADRLARLLAESSERYLEVAAAADRAIVAGNACQQSYEALTN